MAHSATSLTSSHGRFGCFVAALGAEASKARSFPAVGRTMLLGALLMLGAAIFGVGQMSQFMARGRTDALGGLSMADWPLLLLHYGQAIPILLAGWIVGQDLPVGPRRTAFLATARRGRLLAAKLTITALVAFLAGIVCTIAALIPLAAASAGGDETISLAPYCWLIGYWVLIAFVTGALAAATGSVAFTVGPVLVWTIGLSDLVAAQVPALGNALDQAFKAAYLQGGAMPATSALVAAGIQVVAAVALGSTLFLRRDAQ